jgi:hypothetical protein
MKTNKIRPITAWAAIVDGKIDALEIYDTQDIHLSSNERLIKIIIIPYEDFKSIQKNS